MRIGLISITLLVVFSVVIPAVASAALVPCDGSASNPCRACDLVSLAQNVITWIIGIMVLIIALIFAMGGLKMVVSRGDTGSVSSARSMMTNAVVGLLILLSAYLIINTILTRLMGGNVPVWSKIECVAPEVAGPGVPGEPGECSVTPLTAITDPAALQMEGGQTLIWNNPTLEACVNKFTGLVGGSPTSAYRPPAYQTHLREVHDKWCAQNLRTNSDEACADLKGQVSGEMGKHQLSCNRPVGVNSNHSSGNAVDISGIAHGSSQVLAAANESCLTWPLGNSDPVHYELKAGCTCN